MQQRLIWSCILFLAGISMPGVKAQEIIPATGGNAIGSGGSSSYTVGQLMYASHDGPGGTIAEGIQQPYEIIETGTKDPGWITLSVSAYPNPASDYLVLSFDGPVPSRTTYQLYDMNGKLLVKKKIGGERITLSMNQLLPATYLLIVVQDNKELKTFKIIKH